MKGKPQPHFWTEIIERNSVRTGVPNVLAVNVCRAWDVPANGVFMIFTSDEMLAWDSRERCRNLVLKKLEAREKALVDWYGRQAKHHLADTELLPSERRARTAARGAGSTEPISRPDSFYVKNPRTGLDSPTLL